MSLPDEINVSLTVDGLSFSFSVCALQQGSERIFPDRVCGDEFRTNHNLQRAVVQAAACALDVAVYKFQEGFQNSLSKVLSDLSVKNEVAQ